MIWILAALLFAFVLGLAVAYLVLAWINSEHSVAESGK